MMMRISLNSEVDTVKNIQLVVLRCGAQTWMDFSMESIDIPKKE